jgi:hypothetical protein
MMTYFLACANRRSAARVVRQPGLAALFFLSLFLVLVITFVPLCFAGYPYVQRHHPGRDTFVWDAPVMINRVPKPNRKRPASRIERAPLLSLEWRVLKRGLEGTPTEVNPNILFHAEDLFRLAIKVNQRGYLYIISQTGNIQGAMINQPHVIFPNPNINEGRNDLRKDEQYFIPKYCSQLNGLNDCWWKVGQNAGREVFTVIFSRDEIMDLSDHDSINRLKASLTGNVRRTVRPGLKLGQVSHAIMVTNIDPRNNEELIETIVIRHEK